MSPPPPPHPRRSRYDKMFTMNVGCYSETKKLANGRCIMSDALDAGGHSWRIAFYPNGRLAAATGSVSLFLQLDDAGGAVADDVQVECSFMLHEVGGVAPPRIVSSKVIGAVGRRRSALGFESLVSPEELEKSGLLKHDRFTIRCDFTVFPKPAPVVRAPPPPSAPPESSAPPPSLSGLHADLGRLLETKERADVEFEVCGKVFAAHKLVLAARSPVFKADFFGPAKEKTTSYIRIVDMHPDAFQALLHYIYSDSFPETVTNATEEAAVLARDLLVAADRYDLKDLKALTEKELCNHISVSMVLPTLALAEHHQCWKLKKMCLEFIASNTNTRTIMANEDMEHLARSCPSVVKDVLTKILDTREATPSNPLVISVDDSFYVFVFIFILPLAFCALLFWVLLVDR